MKFMRSLKISATTLCTAVVLAGCSTLGPAPYQRPELPTKVQWEAPTMANASEAIAMAWWQAFNDPILDLLVNTAIERNHDLHVAAARVMEAEASASRAAGRRLPTLSLQTEHSRVQRFSGPSQYGDDTKIGGQLNWELDVWNKLKRQVKAGVANQAAIEAEWRAVWLKITANVGLAYFEIRRLDEQIHLQELAVAATEENKVVFEHRMQAGFGTITDVHAQEAELNKLQRNSLELKRQRKLAENELALLIGKPAGKVNIKTGRIRDIVVPVKVPAGLPSDLIARRPDILAAEYQVLGAYELLGVAKLEKLPSFSLTGFAGDRSATLARLLDSWTLGLASAIRIPIFDPAIEANIKAADARSQAARWRYQKAVMQAYKEVENALQSLSNRKQQHQLLEEQHSKLEEVAEQKRGQLAAGLITQLEIFEAERSLLDASSALLQNYEAILVDTVSLYQALGGGWPKSKIGEASS